MDKKEKLLNSLDGLEMSFKKKQEFVNILVGDSGSDSGGSDSSESTMEYLDVSEVDFVNNGTKEGNLLMYSFMVKCNHTMLGDNAIVPIGQLYIAGTSNVTFVYALAFDFSAKCIVSSNIKTVNVTFKEVLIQTGWTEEELIAIPRITKEEFYNLNSDNN